MKASKKQVVQSVQKKRKIGNLEVAKKRIITLKNAKNTFIPGS